MMFSIVIPLFLLLFGNIGILVWYVKRSTKPKETSLNELSEEEKELLADLNQWEQENVDEPLSEEQEMADLLADLDQWEENNS